MITLKSAVLVAVITFCLGAGISWLVLQDHLAGNKVPEQPPTYLIPAPANANAVAGASASTSQPDVSQLPPADAAVTLANWNYDQKNWVPAIEYYQRAITLGADTPDVHTDLGNAFRFSGEPKKALDQYQIAQTENPQHENSLYNMATLYDQVFKDRVNALRLWQDYLKRFPNGEKAPLVKQSLGEAGGLLTGTGNQP